MQSGIMAQNNSIIIQDNCLTSDKPEMNDGMNGFKEQELLIIPESAEFDSDYSSSKNSKDSNSTSVNHRKKVELSISQNTNFSFSSIYDNINKISEGNYSTDDNLRKSVTKLIGFYLKEKKNKLKNGSFSFNGEKSDILATVREVIEKDNKENENEKEKKFNSNNTDTTPTKNKNQKDKDKNNNKIKDKGKNKEKEKDKNNKNKEEDKEKTKEKDVWAFLDENDEDEFQYKYKPNKEDYSKTPKPKNSKKIMNFTSTAKNESKFKKDEPSNFMLDNKEQSKKNPKRKSRPKKCSTLINPKQIKKKIEKNEKEQSNMDNLDGKSSSLDLSLHDNFKQQENYIKNYYKTYKAKGKDLNKEEDNK
jgi:hypothetical protein